MQRRLILQRGKVIRMGGQHLLEHRRRLQSLALGRENHSEIVAGFWSFRVLLMQTFKDSSGEAELALSVCQQPFEVLQLWVWAEYWLQVANELLGTCQLPSL